MATVNAVIENFGGSAVRVTWPNMANGDVGAAVNYHLHADRSVQVKGTFGVGGSVAMKGSNDGSTFVPLTDMRGTDLAVTTGRLEQIEDCSYAFRPEVTAGDGTTSLTVILFARKGE